MRREHSSCHSPASNACSSSCFHDLTCLSHSPHPPLNLCSLHSSSPPPEYFIPAGILLKCFLETSDRELYAKLVGSVEPRSPHQKFLQDRAEMLLRQPQKHGLHTRCAGVVVVV